MFQIIIEGSGRYIPHPEQEHNSCKGCVAYIGDLPYSSLCNKLVEASDNLCCNKGLIFIPTLEDFNEQD